MVYRTFDGVIGLLLWSVRTVAMVLPLLTGLLELLLWSIGLLLQSIGLLLQSIGLLLWSMGLLLWSIILLPRSRGLWSSLRDFLRCIF